MLGMLGMTDFRVGILCSGFFVLCFRHIDSWGMERIPTQGKQCQGKTMKVATADKYSLYINQWLTKAESRSRLGAHGCTSPDIPKAGVLRA
jgi:hypothetical protein